MIAAVITLGSCKENTLINSKVSPAKNAIGVFDTNLSVITHSYYDNNAQTSTNLSGVPIYQAVGSITDPFFGTMTGATYFNLVPFNTDPTFFNNNTVDSAVLVLPFSGFTYGDTSNTSLTQTYQVFYVLDTMGYNTAYYSYSTKPIDAVYPLSNPTTINMHQLYDSLTYTIPKNRPGLRIPLKLNALLSHLQPAQTKLTGTNPFQDFLSTFNGVCVRVADTRQSSTAIPYFQLDGNDFYSEAGIILYYHANGTTPSPDSSLIQPYYFNTAYCAHFNSITKSYSHYPVNNLFSSVQVNDSIIALQNLPGASLDVVIPGISHLPAGIINKAELQLAVLPGPYNNGIYSTPEKLYPTGVGGVSYPGQSIVTPGLTYVIADYYPISSTTPLIILDGYVHQITRSGVPMQVFTIDIPREVMTSIKANNDTLHLQINGTQEFYGAFHLVAGGGSYHDTLYRPKLFVVYSKLK